jgi:hypothetical protein
MYRFLVVIALFATGVAAAEPAHDPASIQAAMEQMSKTGPEHAALARMVGSWKVQSSMWMAPGAPPEVSQGTATITALFGGKWFRQEYQGSMMGHPYNGVGMSGYDTVEKQYVSTWCDSFSTMLTTMTGTSTDGGTTVTYTSEIKHCPMTGGPVTTRSVCAQDGADRMTFTMFQNFGSGEVKAMELIYTRVNP